MYLTGGRYKWHRYATALTGEPSSRVKKTGQGWQVPWTNGRAPRGPETAATDEDPELKKANRATLGECNRSADHILGSVTTGDRYKSNAFGRAPRSHSKTYHGPTPTPNGQRDVPDAVAHSAFTETGDCKARRSARHNLARSDAAHVALQLAQTRMTSIWIGLDVVNAVHSLVYRGSRRSNVTQHTAV